MVGSFVHGLELFFSFLVLGICIVPWDYGSRSLGVAEVGELSSLTYSATCMVPWDYGSRSLSAAAVGDVTQMLDRNGWRCFGAASAASNTHTYKKTEMLFSGP